MYSIFKMSIKPLLITHNYTTLTIPQCTCDVCRCHHQFKICILGHYYLITLITLMYVTMLPITKRVPA